jgi:hypothetical protein
MGAGMKTLVEYMYRDASNYKQFGSFVLDGSFCLEDIEALLWDGEFFIPERVGVATLVPAEKTRDDHYLHTIELTRETDVSESLMSAETFIARVRRAAREGWFYERLSGVEAEVAREEGRRVGLANPNWDEW